MIMVMKMMIMMQTIMITILIIMISKMTKIKMTTTENGTKIVFSTKFILCFFPKKLSDTNPYHRSKYIVFLISLTFGKYNRIMTIIT